MNKDNIFSQNISSIEMSVEQWHRYTKEGLSLPMITVLNGNSMEPLIRSRLDFVTIIPVYRELYPGDIVLFEILKGKYLVHRVYRVLDGGVSIQTWGDNCYNPDPIMPLSSVWGIAVTLKKDGKIYKLDTDQQRKKGLCWLNSKYRRAIWFMFRNMKNRIKHKNSM